MLQSLTVKRFVVLFFVTALFLSAVFYVSGFLVTKSAKFHYYLVPDVGVDKIKLEVIYFVPNDQKVNPDYFSVISNALMQAQGFHLREFNRLSALRYVLYPTPVVGEKSSAFYDGNDTSRGNPNASSEIFSEVARRIYNENGDLYNESFQSRKGNELPIKVFVYEGVGASSGVLNVLVAYEYFSNTNYGATVLYHEILHNLGVPDSYDYETNVSHSDDIMGSGRNKPIEQTYIRNEIKEQMVR